MKKKAKKERKTKEDADEEVVDKGELKDEAQEFEEEEERDFDEGEEEPENEDNE